MLLGEEKPKSGSLQIFKIVAAYWCVSISMVYLNKVLLSNENASIPAPMFVTWFQCICTAFICIAWYDLFCV